MQELGQLTINDIEDNNKFIFINETKTDIPRSFVFSGNYVNFYRKCSALRPRKAIDEIFFHCYRNRKCIKQVVGTNQFYGYPKIIATFLKLKNPKLYTRHSFRRFSATILEESGSDLLTVKKNIGSGNRP